MKFILHNNRFFGSLISIFNFRYLFPMNTNHLRVIKQKKNVHVFLVPLILLTDIVLLMLLVYFHGKQNLSLLKLPEGIFFIQHVKRKRQLTSYACQIRTESFGFDPTNFSSKIMCLSLGLWGGSCSMMYFCFISKMKCSKLSL